MQTKQWFQQHFSILQSNMKLENIVDGYYIDPKYLSVYRILYCSIILLIVGLPSYTWMINSLNYLFAPPEVSFAGLFHQFPDPWFFMLLTGLNLVFFIMMFLGVATKWTSLLFSITCLVGHNFWYSFGKIDHLILWYIAPVFLGFAGWGRYFSVNAFRVNYIYKEVSFSTNAILIFIFALSIGFSMFTSAAEKMAGGWLSWQGEGVRFNFIKNFLSLNRDNLLTKPLIRYHNHIFWKFMDYSALIMEFGFILSLIRIQYFRIFLAIGVVFHMLVLLMFNIPFYSNLIVYLLFVDWHLIIRNIYGEKNGDNFPRERLCVKFIAAISLFFTTFWVMYLFQKRSFFNFPGLLESLLTGFSIPNAFDKSLFAFFFLVFIFTIYVIYCHLEVYIKNKL